MRRSSSRGAPSTIAADGSSNAAAMRSARDGKRRVEPGRLEQHPRELRAEVGLAAALIGLRRPSARDLGDARDGHGGHDVDAERDPVLGAFDREAPDRRDVEVVERGRAGDPRRDAEHGAPVRGDEQHGEQVDDAERERRRDLAQRIQQQRRERDGDDCRREAGRP